MKKRLVGINAAAWFYAQPGFHAPVVTWPQPPYTEKDLRAAEERAGVFERQPDNDQDGGEK